MCLSTGIPQSELVTGIPHYLSVHSWIQPSVGPWKRSEPFELLQDQVIQPVVLCPQVEEVQTLMTAFWILVATAGTFTRTGILLLSLPAQLHLLAWEPAPLNLQPPGTLQGVQLPLKGWAAQWIHHTWVWGDGYPKHPFLWIPSVEPYTCRGLRPHPQIMMLGPPGHLVKCHRVLASTRVCPFLASWMSHCSGNYDAARSLCNSVH